MENTRTEDHWDHWQHCHHAGEYRGAAHSIGNLIYNRPKKIPITFNNISNYDYHFIIKELAEELKNNLLAYKKTLENK